MTARGSHHLYVHVPFCRLVCAYCDFVTVGGRRGEIPRYVDAVLRELAMGTARGELRTIYFGGGTPSLLAPEQVARVIQVAMDRWSTRTVDEVTVEANPSRREAPDWSGLRTAGVTRISLGVQALRDEDLVRLARGHTVAEAREAYAGVRAAGFDNVSIDLIYGVPGQSLADWRDVLAAALALEPEHVSLYALQLALAPDEWAAPPRPGALRWRRRVADEQDDGVAADQYRLAEERLDAAGYRHYELSSWALPGRESLHNSAYWQRRPYTGIGAGAHSYDRSRRWWNVRDLDRYLSLVAEGRLPRAGGESLDEPTRAFEAIALGLRQVDGTSRTTFAAEFGVDPEVRFAQAMGEATASGLLELDGDRIRLTPQGRLFASDALIGFLPGAVATLPASA